MADIKADQHPKAFVIGWPISHSLSAHLHRYWLNQYEIKGQYEKIAVKPEDLISFLANIKCNEYVGGNVTIPHKEQVYNLISERDAIASNLKAANTIWFENDKIKAGNTDAHGFSSNLDDFAPQWRHAKTALVLGAGGASRAIILALINAGFEKIFILNRTVAKAQMVAKQMGNQCIAGEFDAIEEYLKQSDLLINTTSLGMIDQPELEIDLTPLPKSALVCDIVYNPIKTQLLIQAEALNITTIDGIGMLLHQAVPGFEKWFAFKPRVTIELRKHMLDILSGVNS